MAVRKKWVDSLRFFAIMIVFLTHFITILYPEASRFWHEGLCAVILCGILPRLYQSCPMILIYQHIFVKGIYVFL